jgi:hypothetical protein
LSRRLTRKSAFADESILYGGVPYGQRIPSNRVQSLCGCGVLEVQAGAELLHCFECVTDRRTLIVVQGANVSVVVR